MARMKILSYEDLKSELIDFFHQCLEEKYNSKVITEHLIRKFKVDDIWGTISDKASNGYYDRLGEHEFQQDVFKEFGLVDNPKRFKLYSKAWDKGHAYGYHEVLGEFQYMLELILDNEKETNKT